MNTVCSFDKLAEEELSDAGGKGGTLAQLYRAGCPVPEGFVILADAFDHDELRLEAWDAASTTQLRLKARSNSKRSVTSTPKATPPVR